MIERLPAGSQTHHCVVRLYIPFDFALAVVLVVLFGSFANSPEFRRRAAVARLPTFELFKRSLGPTPLFFRSFFQHRVRAKLADRGWCRPRHHDAVPAHGEAAAHYGARRQWLARWRHHHDVAPRGNWGYDGDAWAGWYNFVVLA